MLQLKELTSCEMTAATRLYLDMSVRRLYLTTRPLKTTNVMLPHHCCMYEEEKDWHDLYTVKAAHTCIYMRQTSLRIRLHIEISVSQSESSGHVHWWCWTMLGRLQQAFYIIMSCYQELNAAALLPNTPCFSLMLTPSWSLFASQIIPFTLHYIH